MRGTGVEYDEMISLSELIFDTYYLVQSITAGVLGFAACFFHHFAMYDPPEKKREDIVLIIVSAIGAILMAYMHLILRLFPQ